jgi:hypothetical protein
MAVVTNGGGVLSAIFTLFLIPVIYSFAIAAPAAALARAAAGPLQQTGDLGSDDGD